MIFIDIFETWGQKEPENVHVVSYRRIKTAKLSYGKDSTPISRVTPLSFLKTISYWNLEDFSHVIGKK
jgi:hypothetical protein